MLTAVVAFILSVGFSFGRTATRAFDPRDPPHLSMYGLAFSMTLGGCVPAVLLAATVGTPQTRLSVRRILCLFEAAQHGRVSAVEAPEVPPNHFRALCGYDIRRCLRNGAVPSWRFDRWTWTATSQSAAWKQAVHRSFWREFCAILVVFIGSLGAIWLSASVPPTGCVNCRIVSELIIMFSYFASYVLGVAFSWVSHKRSELHFWLVLTKDICSTLVLTAIIVLTGLGSLNRWGCWITCDKLALCVPNMTREVVESRLKSLYPAIIFSTFTLLAASWVVIAFVFRDGISVYLQRDDEEVRRVSREISRALRRASTWASNLASTSLKRGSIAIADAERMDTEMRNIAARVSRSTI